MISVYFFLFSNRVLYGYIYLPSMYVCCIPTVGRYICVLGRSSFDLEKDVRVES